MAKNLGTLTLNLIAQTARMTGPMRDAEGKVKTSTTQMSRDIDRVNSSMRGAESSAVNFKGALLAIGAAVGIGSLKNITDEYINMENKLKLVTNSTLELKEAMNQTYMVANSATISWSAAAEIYAKLAQNTESLKLSQQDLGGVTDTIAKAISISGVSSDEASRSMTQLGQAFSLGTLRGQDFKSVMQQTPAVMKAVAIGLGVTNGELLQMASNGELTNKVLIEAFQKSAPEISRMYAETATSIGGASETIKNAFMQFIGDSDDAVGASKALVNSLLLISENFGTVATVIGVAAWVSLTRAVVSQTTAMKATIAVKLQEIAATNAAMAAKVQETAAEVNSARAKVGALAAEQNLIVAKLRGNVTTTQKIALEARATQVAIQLAVAERGLTAATIANTAATNANAVASSRAGAAKSLLLGLSGGWVGLGITVASVAAGYMLFSDRSAEAQKIIEIEGEAVSDLSKKYAQLNEQQRDNEIRAIKAEMQDLSKQMAVASSDLTSFIEALPISDAKINQYRKLTNEFTKLSGSMKNDSNSYYQAIKDVGGLSDSQLSKLSDLSIAYVDSDKKITALKKAQDALAGSMKGVSKEASESEKRIAAQAEAAIAAQAVFDKISGAKGLEKKTAEMEAILLKNGQFTKAQIDLMTKWAQDYEFQTSLIQTPVARQDLQSRLETLRIQTKNGEVADSINEKEKERVKLIEQQAKLQQKQALYAAATDQKTQNMLKVYQAFMSTGVLSSQQAAYFTSEVGREGDFSNKNLFGSHTDANNSAQNMGFISWQKSRAKELQKFLGSMDLLEGNGKIKQTQEALNAQAQFLVKEIFSGQYKAAESALSSNDYKKLESTIGKTFILWDYAGKKIDASSHHKKRDDYFKQITSLVGGEGGDLSSFISQITDQGSKIAEAQAKALEDQAQLQAKYFNEAETRAQTHKKALEDIQKTFVGNDAEIRRLTALENSRFKAAEAAIKLQQEQEIEGWRWVGEEKIKKDAEVNRALIIANDSMNKTQKENAIKSIDEQAAHELDVHRKTQQEKTKALRDSLTQSIQAQQAAALDNQARRSMNKFSYEGFKIEQGVQSGLSSANSSYEAREKEINAKNEFDQFIIDSEAERNELLLAAEQEFQNAKLAIMEEAQERQSELQKAQVEYQIQGIANMLEATTSLVGGYLGEASGAYRTLFGIQRAYNTAIAAMNVWTAASQAYAQSASPTVWGRAADAAIAAAQAQGFQTLIQGITPVGMAHNGMSSIPQEGTWLLDGGERVVSPRQNQDLTQMINNFNGGGGAGSAASENNMKILNLIDRDELVGEYMRGGAGEKIVLNLIKSNSTTIKRALG